MSRQVCIEPHQQTLHIVGEIAAVTLAVPLMGYFAFNKQLPTWARVGAGAVGVFSLIVDGLLLYKYARKSNGWWGR